MFIEIDSLMFEEMEGVENMASAGVMINLMGT